jgi:hypothetical protein
MFKPKNLILFFLPFLMMLFINEATRPFIKEKPHFQQGITTMNSAVRTPEKCSWVCHNDTIYCKQNHVKFLKPFFLLTDLMYFGVILLLGITGHYGLANIFFLVFLFPFIIYGLLIKSIQTQRKIRELKKNSL